MFSTSSIIKSFFLVHFFTSVSFLSAQNEPEFRNDAVLVAGNDYKVGAVYLFEDVQTNANGSGIDVDALVTIVDSTLEASLPTNRPLDKKFAHDDRFEPKINYPQVGASLWFRIDFIVAGSADSDVSNAVPFALEDFSMDVVGVSELEWVEIQSGSAFVLESVTSIFTQSNGSVMPNSTRFSSPDVSVSADPDKTEAVVTTMFRRLSSVNIVCGRDEAHSNTNQFKGVSFGFLGQASFDDPSFTFFNTPPIVVDQIGTTVEDVPTLSIDLLANASDPEDDIDSSSIILTDPNDALNIGQVGRPLIIPNEGTYDLSSAGTVVFTPVSGFLGFSTVDFIVADVHSEISNVASLTIAVFPDPVGGLLGLNVWGNVFDDADLDGTLSVGDIGQGNVELILYKDNNGDSLVDVGDTQILKDTTNASGEFMIPVSSVMGAHDVRDEFSVDDNYSTNDGSENWSGSWIKVLPNDRLDRAEVNGGVLKFENFKEDYYIYREIDLLGATSVELSFFWYSDNLGVDDTLCLEVSSDAGLTYERFSAFGPFGASEFGYVSVDISLKASANSIIRFRGGVTSWNDNTKVLMIDDLNITYTKDAQYLLSINQSTLPPNTSMTTDTLSVVHFSQSNRVVGEKDFGFLQNSIETDSVTKIGYDNATLYATIHEGAYVVEYGFCYSKDNTLANLVVGNANTHTVSPYVGASINIEDVDYSYNVVGLTNRSGYYFRSYMKDASGHYYYGKVIRFLSEKRDFSLLLDGNDACVIIDKESTDKYINDWGDSDNTFSVEFWMRKGDSDLYSYQISNISLTEGYEILLWNGKVSFHGPEIKDVRQPIRILDTDWHHIVIVYSNGNIKIFVDNSLSRDEALKNSSGVNTTLSRPVFSTNCVIGGRLKAGGLDHDFNGNIDALRFWNVALTPEQVSELLYDDVQEGVVPNTVETVGARRVIPDLAWDNLTASMDFNVMSTTLVEKDFPVSLDYSSQDDYQDYRFLHSNAHLGEDKVSFNAIALENVKLSPSIPRANWRRNPIDSVWTNSENWSGYAFPGQGATTGAYPDVTTTDLADDGDYCQYAVIDSSVIHAVVKAVTPPEVQVLVDRHDSISTYRVDDANGARLTILREVVPAIFEELWTNSDSNIVIEEGSVEVH